MEFKVEIVKRGEILTLIALICHGPNERWYQSEVDINPPFDAIGFQNALRALGDELEQNLSSDKK